MAKGDTKTNQYLDIAANGTRADFPASCCETRSQTLIREVGERIMDLEDEVERLENNPDVADIVATYADLQSYDTSQLTDKDVIRVLQDETHDGDSTYYRWSTSTSTWTYIGESKQYTDFVGTDGTTAGTAGLVPAPATTDTDKYLKSDGTWAEVQGGGGGTNNFNQLTNRPSYNGTTMTGSTDIPEVKTYTAGTNISISAQNEISATDTTYTAGTGLDLTDTTFSADTTVLATKTDLEGKQDELTAGDNVTIEDESGALVISATDTTYSDFTGTDGSSAGEAGLVPAPATTDAGKFLSASGLWEAVQSGGGGIKELSSADYNYPTANPDRGALWLLDNGLYTAPAGVMLAASTASYPWYNTTDKTILVGGSDAYKGIYTFLNGNTAVVTTQVSDGTEANTYTLLKSTQVLQTTGTSTTDVMSQNAVTSMVYADPSTKQKVQIGSQSAAAGVASIALGYNASATKPYAVAVGPGTTSGTSSGNAFTIAIGSAASATGQHSVALGSLSSATEKGQFDIGCSNGTSGYNNTGYRLLTGVHDPVNAHDAATKGYVDTAVAGATYDPTISNNTLYL